MIPFTKFYIKYSYLETRHKLKNMCYDVFSLHNSTLFSVNQAITLLLSKLKVVMYILTTLYEFSFNLHVESMAKTPFIQLSLGNSSSQTIANPFHSLQVYWHLPIYVNTYYISCILAYTTCWRDGELKLQLMMSQLRIRWFKIKPALGECVAFGGLMLTIMEI